MFQSLGSTTNDFLSSTESKLFMASFFNSRSTSLTLLVAAPHFSLQSRIHRVTHNIAQFDVRDQVWLYLVPDFTPLLVRIRIPYKLILTPFLSHKAQSERNVRALGDEVAEAVHDDRSVTVEMRHVSPSLLLVPIDTQQYALK